MRGLLLLVLAGCSSASVGAVAQGDAGADVARPVDAGHDVAAGDDAGEDAAPELDAADDGAIADAGVDTSPPPECTSATPVRCIPGGNGVETCQNGTWVVAAGCSAQRTCRCFGPADCQCQ